MEMVSIETIEEEILNLEKRDTSYAVCERLAWLYIVRDHLKKPTVDATVMEPRITGELTGSEFLKAASNVDYAALMGVLDNNMSCIKAVCPKKVRRRHVADPCAAVAITCQTVSNTCHTPKRASVTGVCISTSHFSSPVKLSNNKGPLY